MREAEALEESRRGEGVGGQSEGWEEEGGAAPRGESTKCRENIMERGRSAPFEPCVGVLGLPQQIATNWSFKTAETSPLPVLEDSNLKSRCGQSRVPSEGSRGRCFLPPPTPRGSRCPLACGHITSVSLFSRGLSPVSVCFPFSSFKGHSHWI